MPDKKDRAATAAKVEKKIATKTKQELTDEEMAKIVGGKGGKKSH